MTHIDGDEMDFGVTVFSGLGGRHVNDFARSALDDDVSVLPDDHRMEGDQVFFGLNSVGKAHLKAEHCIGKVSEAPEPV